MHIFQYIVNLLVYEVLGHGSVPFGAQPVYYV